MIFGISKLGKMKTYNHQYITTRFVIVGLPLIPLGSLFCVNEMDYIDLGLNKISIAKTYLAWFTLVLAIWLIVGSQHYSYYFLSEGMAIVLGLMSFVASMYFFFKFQKTKEEEKEMRDLFQKAIGVNLLPEYFQHSSLYSFQRQLMQTLKDKYHITKWMDSVKNNEYSNAQLPLLFAISAFQNAFSKSKISEEIYSKLLMEYKASSK